MPLEAVMICVDNSEYTRNGDYGPTRYAAEVDAVNLVCGAKTNQNPENSVGILAMGGERVEVMLTPTTDLGRMIVELNRIQIKGISDLPRGITTAQLALKHRQNKNQKQRIVALVGSPIEATEKQLETLGKNLKKNNVSIDVVSFGEVEANSGKLNKLLQAANSNDTSHLLEIPVGPRLLCDVLLSSPIVTPEGEAPPLGVAGGGGDAGGASGAAFEFGVDPATDPELAMALRISMEEERARQQKSEPETAGAEGATASATDATASSAAAADGTAAAAAPAAPGVTPAAPSPAAGDVPITAADIEGMEDMDEELRQALMLSLQETSSEPPPAAPVPPSESGGEAQATPPSDGKKKEEEPPPPPKKPKTKEEKPDTSDFDAALFQDPAFVSDLLGTLPGVDINDPKIQEALNAVGGDKKDKKDNKDNKDDKDNKDNKDEGGNGGGSSSQ